MNDMTLATFLEWEKKQSDQEIHAKISAAKSIQKGKGDLPKEPPERVWPRVARAAARALGGALSVTLKDVLVGGWQKYEELRKCAESKEGGHVDLLQHTITSTHEPEVEIKLGPTTLATVKFEVELDLEIDAATLVVEGGRITKVDLGRCTGEGKISCEGIPLGKPVTKEITFPGQFPVGKGIPIPH